MSWLANRAVDPTAGSHSLAAARHCERSITREDNEEKLANTGGTPDNCYFSQRGDHNTLRDSIKSQISWLAP